MPIIYTIKHIIGWKRSTEGIFEAQRNFQHQVFFVPSSEGSQQRSHVIGSFRSTAREGAGWFPSATWRRIAVATVATFVGLSLAGLAPKAQAAPLGWKSGATCGDRSFQSWRGQPARIVHSFIPHKTWSQMRDEINSRVPVLVRQAPQVSVSLVLFPESEGRAHARCARGDYDARFKEFGRLLVRHGAPNAVVRLGHEINANPRYEKRNWLVDSRSLIPAYRTCFRRLATSLKTTAPKIAIEWTMAKRGYLPYSVQDVYPGDAHVDIIGINSYDNGPKYFNEAIWDRMYMATRYGGPVGFGAWLKFSKERKKKLAVSEWGVWERDGIGYATADNPFYISKMYEFFRKNAPNIAYETYYNCPVEHRLFPNSRMPKSSAMYRKLWSTHR